MCQALLACVRDANILVRRRVLEVLLSHFPLLELPGGNTPLCTLDLLADSQSDGDLTLSLAKGSPWVVVVVVVWCC